jgi:hypothetical protein
MRRILLNSSAIFAFLFVVHAVPSSSASDSIASGPVKPSMGYYFCTAMEDPTPTSTKGKAFFSGVFQAEGNSLNPVRGAYAKFLQKAYAYAQDPTTFDNSIQCTGLNSREEAESVEQARMKPGKQLNPEGTIETGWTYQAQ